MIRHDLRSIAPPHPALPALAVLVLIACGWWTLGSHSADAQATPARAEATLDAAELYRRVKLAAVEVLVDDHLNGSGWIADAEGHVITAAHVAAGDNQRIEVLSSDLGRISAKLVAIDRGHDLALLKLPKRDGGYPFLPLADAAPTIGQEIYLFGTPIYRHHLLSPGRVAQPEAAYEYLFNFKQYIRCIYVTGVTPRGTSGGAWVNGAGRVVGVQSGMMRDDNAQAGIAFVIPPEAIRRLLTTKESAATPSLRIAVEEIWEQPVDFLKKYPRRVEGLVLRQVDEQGPAGRAGLRDGQLVIEVNGRPVRYRDELLRAIRATAANGKVTLTYLKPDSVKRYTAVVETQRLEN